MIYYIITVVVLLLILIYQYFTFISVYYTNKSLSKFREINHAVVMDLSENVKDKMSLEEIMELRNFAGFVGSSIHHFDALKAGMTRFATVKSMYYNILYSSERLDREYANDFGSIMKYKIMYAQAVQDMFNAIPLFKARLFLFLSKIFLSIMVRLGFEKFNKQLRRVNRITEIERNIFHNNGCAA